jgi:ubiquinone/menaquinone biosynthesis C-methylase UbiE
MVKDDEFYQFEQVKLEVKDFPSEGFILDIGGGGEGVIGILKGSDVIAIDLRKDELEETGDGPLKIVMDARDLKFLDNSFNTASAFFSLMYIKSQEDQQKIFEEACRVLKPGGYFHVWDVDLEQRPETEKEFYIVLLRYRVGEEETGTGYGQRWPEEPRGEKHYITLAQAAGFRHISTERNMHTFYMKFQKVGSA